MCQLTRPLRATAMIVLAASSTIAGAAEDDSRGQRNAYVVAPVVSNVSGRATVQDTVLQNAWGWPSARGAVLSGSMTTSQAARPLQRRWYEGGAPSVDPAAGECRACRLLPCG
jgi:hypothetical protein